MKASIRDEVITTTFRHLKGKGWIFPEGAEDRAKESARGWPPKLTNEQLFGRVKELVDNERLQLSVHDLKAILRDRQRVIGSDESLFVRGLLEPERLPALALKWERLLEQEASFSHA